MSQSLKWRTLLSVVGAAIMSLALLASTASATEPAEGYERFAGCPSPEENENIDELPAGEDYGRLLQHWQQRSADRK